MGTFCKISLGTRPRRLLNDGGSEGLGIWIDSFRGVNNFPAGFEPTSSPQRISTCSHCTRDHSPTLVEEEEEEGITGWCVGTVVSRYHWVPCFLEQNGGVYVWMWTPKLRKNCGWHSLPAHRVCRKSSLATNSHQIEQDKDICTRILDWFLHLHCSETIDYQNRTQVEDIWSNIQHFWPQYFFPSKHNPCSS